MKSSYNIVSFLNEILSPERTICNAPGASKKRLFETIARVISDDQPSLVYEEVFAQLIAREKLGSTGLGQGIAIPHCRMDACPEPIGTLVTLEKAIDFDAPDDKPVDLLFALLVLQVVYGAFTAGLDAGYAFNTWPTISSCSTIPSG